MFTACFEFYSSSLQITVTLRQLIYDVIPFSTFCQSSLCKRDAKLSEAEIRSRNRIATKVSDLFKEILACLHAV